MHLCSFFEVCAVLIIIIIIISVVQGVVTVLSIVGSLLLILSHVILYPLRRSKSRVLITHLAAASFLQAFPNFIAVFMDFRTRFRIDTTANSLDPTVTNHTSNATENLIICTGTNQVLDETTRVYCYSGACRGGFPGVSGNPLWISLLQVPA